MAARVRDWRVFATTRLYIGRTCASNAFIASVGGAATGIGLKLFLLISRNVVPLVLASRTPSICWGQCRSRPCCDIARPGN